MKNFIAALVICVGLVTASVDADAARRFGGGASFGRPAPTFSQKAAPGAKAPTAPSQAAQQQTRQTPPATAQRPSMMRNMLMGAAAALGIAGLLSMLGINGAGMVSLITGILLALVLFFVFRMVLGAMTAKKATVGASADNRGASANNPFNAERTHQPEPVFSSTPSQEQTSRAGSVMDEFSQSATVANEFGNTDVTPADFDKKSFLDVARDNYYKLQSAWDSGNVVEISDFTTNDVFIAITHQLRERGNITYKTVIEEIHNELLGIAQEGDEYLASVRFTGRLTINGEVETVDEIWVLVKPVEGLGGWLLAGIKQNNE